MRLLTRLSEIVERMRETLSMGMRACAYGQPLHHDVIAASPCQLIHVSSKVFKSISNFIMEQVDVQIIVGLLRALPVTSTLEDDELDEIARRFRFHTFDRGTTLIRGGHVSHTLLAPLTGELSVLPVSEKTSSSYGLPSARRARTSTPTESDASSSRKGPVGAVKRDVVTSRGGMAGPSIQSTFT